MAMYDQIIIIYNPNSTGDSEALAKSFAKAAKIAFPDAETKLIATKFVAHAEEIAAEISAKKGKILLVSSSGDGGYHEVVNGLMSSKKLTSNITAAVLPAGNANDHSRTMHDTPLNERLAKAKPTRIDLLKITIKQSGKTVTRYAHSYVGLGFTPQVARELNKHQLNPVRETYLVLKTFKQFKAFRIKRFGKVRKYDSLVFSNINQMAKVLTLADKNRPRDGRFEIIAIKNRGKLFMLLKFIQAAISWIQPQKRARHYSFISLQAMPMQLDGEVFELEKNARVRITNQYRALKTLI